MFQKIFVLTKLRSLWEILLRAIRDRGMFGVVSPYVDTARALQSLGNDAVGDSLDSGTSHRIVAQMPKNRLEVSV
jgi:hypothetical protein